MQDTPLPQSLSEVEYALRVRDWNAKTWKEGHLEQLGGDVATTTPPTKIDLTSIESVQHATPDTPPISRDPSFASLPPDAPEQLTPAETDTVFLLAFKDGRRIAFRARDEEERDAWVGAVGDVVDAAEGMVVPAWLVGRLGK
ncbi:hypothetical protein BDK51DRAFT_41964 [Blyttiomyces helicus]|uniref:PH domain-containing protein n=1 Tax=Blyttiomyces helicus TaxID=388810 RepID=A0A4P9W7A5_9FUNG|nr:hypothetical protein BDK51DRAFT_41964 [Blyttiomyces helicus]|eukprot:RKO86898.1 hypothetical protein BDK51DRAFT_41964 [Blyttiomyces helicus]